MRFKCHLVERASRPRCVIVRDEVEQLTAERVLVKVEGSTGAAGQSGALQRTDYLVAYSLRHEGLVGGALGTAARLHRPETCCALGGQGFQYN